MNYRPKSDFMFFEDHAYTVEEILCQFDPIPEEPKEIEELSEYPEYQLKPFEKKINELVHAVNGLLKGRDT